MRESADPSEFAGLNDKVKSSCDGNELYCDEDVKEGNEFEKVLIVRDSAGAVGADAAGGATAV